MNKIPVPKLLRGSTLCSVSLVANNCSIVIASSLSRTFWSSKALVVGLPMLVLDFVSSFGRGYVFLLGLGTMLVD